MIILSLLFIGIAAQISFFELGGSLITSKGFTPTELTRFENLTTQIRNLTLPATILMLMSISILVSIQIRMTKRIERLEAMYAKLYIGAEANKTQ